MCGEVGVGSLFCEIWTGRGGRGCVLLERGTLDSEIIHMPTQRYCVKRVFIPAYSATKFQAVKRVFNLVTQQRGLRRC
jgi:hypothetical protein